MIYTINTDASFHPTHKIGAFAFWSVCNEFRIQKSGWFRLKCKDPTDAETKCIINALHVTLQQSKKITKVIINTDSQNSIHKLENNISKINQYRIQNNPNHRKQFLKITHDYNNSIKGRNLKIEFRHVKAHSGKTDKRSYVNEWYDQQAKSFLWKRINQLKSINKLKSSK